MKSLRLSRNSATKKAEAFFRVMIESVEPEESFFQVFWSPAEYPGEAIESILSICPRLGIRNPIARELDYVQFESASDDALHDKKSNVFYSRERYYFPTEKSFVAPLGIIASGEKGEHEYKQLREGFSLTKTEAGIYEVETAIERDKLFDTFIKLIEQLPSIRVFWIKITVDWEDQGREEFWTNENLNTIESIKNFLTTRWADTVANGHVGLTVYSDVGQTNLSIDTHKTVKVLTKSAEMQRRIGTALRSLGFEELAEFHSLEWGYHHWHYRPKRSKSRTKLITALRKDGFKPWEPSEPNLTQ
jgi:hypothetical protein